MIRRRSTERRLVRHRCVCGVIIVCRHTSVREYICDNCDRVCCTLHSRRGADALAAVPGLVEAARARGAFCVEGTLCTWCIAELRGRHARSLAVVTEEEDEDAEVDATDSEPQSSPVEFPDELLAGATPPPPGPSFQVCLPAQRTESADE